MPTELRAIVYLVAFALAVTAGVVALARRPPGDRDRLAIGLAALSFAAFVAVPMWGWVERLD